MYEIVKTMPKQTKAPYGIVHQVGFLIGQSKQVLFSGRAFNFRNMVWVSLKGAIASPDILNQIKLFQNFSYV